MANNCCNTINLHLHNFTSQSYATSSASSSCGGVAGVASGLLALGSLGLAIYNGVTTYQQQQHAAAVCTSSQCAF